MKIDTFEMESLQSTYEFLVDYDLSESGILPVSSDWIDGVVQVHWTPSRAGAFGYLRLRTGTPSLKIAEACRQQQSTRIVPGVHFGTEGFLRIWCGGEVDYLLEGPARIQQALEGLA